MYVLFFVFWILMYSIHVVMHSSNLFIFFLLYSILLCDIPQTIYSSTVDGHLGHWPV